MSGWATSLQAPIVDGAGPVVTFVQVLLGQHEIGFDHFHGAVTEEGLQDVAVAAVAQELDGEGVAKAVR